MGREDLRRPLLNCRNRPPQRPECSHRLPRCPGTTRGRCRKYANRVRWVSSYGVAYEYGYRQPAASAHDRGHERAQALCRHAEGPYPRLQAVRGVSQAVPRNGYGRGYPPVSVAPGRGQLEHLYPRPDYDRAAVLVAHNAAATGSCRRDLSPPRAPEGYAGDEPGRDKAPA